MLFTLLVSLKKIKFIFMFCTSGLHETHSTVARKELLDLGPDYYTHDEYIHCLKKLFLINKLLGFFYSTVKILKQFSQQSSVLDIGCGGGLFILQLSKIFPQMQLHGIDISNAAIMDARQSLLTLQKNKKDMQVSFQLQEQEQLNLARNSYDIILITLVCHHISDDDLVIFLQQAYQAANKAVIINELHRHPLAHWLYGQSVIISIDSLRMMDSFLFDVDSPVWNGSYCAMAGIHDYQLKWCFAFAGKLPWVSSAGTT